MGLAPEHISRPRTGLVAGSGGVASSELIDATDTLREKACAK